MTHLMPFLEFHMRVMACELLFYFQRNSDPLQFLRDIAFNLILKRADELADLFTFIYLVVCVWLVG